MAVRDYFDDSLAYRVVEKNYINAQKFQNYKTAILQKKSKSKSNNLSKKINNIACIVS